MEDVLGVLLIYSMFFSIIYILLIRIKDETFIKDKIKHEKVLTFMHTLL